MASDNVKCFAQVQQLMEINSVMVAVKCMTYNHSHFIHETLNGFSLQKTNFPFVCVVMDDSSTDGEQEVIQAYMKAECDIKNAQHIDIEESSIVLCRSRINHNCVFAFYFLKENLWRTNRKDFLLDNWIRLAKYVAICEGDDYWIDPLKLQKQVDFMEMNNGCSLCFSSAISINGNGNVDRSYYSFEQRYYEGYELLQRWIPTHSVLCRSEHYREFVPADKQIYHFDIYLFLNLASLGSVYCIPDFMGVYRIHESSLSRHMGKAEAELLISQYKYMLMYFQEKRIKKEIRKKMSCITMIQIYNRWYSPVTTLCLILRNIFVNKDFSRNYFSTLYTYFVKRLFKLSNV